MHPLSPSGFAVIITATALLGGCGGSSTPETIITETQLSESQIPAVNSQSDTTTGNDVTTSNPIDENATGSDAADNSETDDSSASSGSVDIQQDNMQDDATADSSQESESTTTEILTASSNVYPNSYCEPGVTSVSFEDYYPPRNNGSKGGVYVPFPASGFGWNGEEICNLEGSRGLDTIEILVPYVAQRPDTDGVTSRGEWLNAVNASTTNYETTGADIDNLLLSPVPGYQDGAGYSEWWAMHDGTNLYIRVRRTNDGSLGSLFLDSTDPWHDDSIELFFDGDNSKGDTYDGVNDFQVLLSGDKNVLPLISQSSAPGLRIFHRFDARFKITEITFNLQSAGIEIGRPIGFDVQINEDDNGGDRDAKWGWFERSGSDRSWYLPAAFGTLLLTDCEDRTTCGSYQSLTQQ